MHLRDVLHVTTWLFMIVQPNQAHLLYMPLISPGDY